MSVTGAALSFRPDTPLPQSLLAPRSGTSNSSELPRLRWCFIWCWSPPAESDAFLTCSQLSPSFFAEAPRFRSRSRASNSLANLLACRNRRQCFAALSRRTVHTFLQRFTASRIVNAASSRPLSLAPCFRRTPTSKNLAPRTAPLAPPSFPPRFRGLERQARFCGSSPWPQDGCRMQLPAPRLKPPVFPTPASIKKCPGDGVDQIPGANASTHRVNRKRRRRQFRYPILVSRSEIFALFNHFSSLATCIASRLASGSLVSSPESSGLTGAERRRL